MTEPTEAGVRPWVAGIADLAVVVVFVVIGRRNHHEDAGLVGFLRVLWPFAVGLVVGWVATSLFRSPMAWRRVVPTWLITVAVGMLLRVAVQGRDLKSAFIVVALLFLGAGMLGWRAVVRFARGRARPARTA
jgi:hypothetical protein